MVMFSWGSARTMASMLLVMMVSSRLSARWSIICRVVVPESMKITSPSRTSSAARLPMALLAPSLPRRRTS